MTGPGKKILRPGNVFLIKGTNPVGIVIPKISAKELIW